MQGQQMWRLQSRKELSGFSELLSGPVGRKPEKMCHKMKLDSQTRAFGSHGEVCDSFLSAMKSHQKNDKI